VPERIEIDMEKRIMERMPGVVFCSRTDPATGKGEWLYLGKNAAALYDIDDAELRADPARILDAVIAEDRARLDAQIAESMSAGKPFVGGGRIRCKNGEIRWLETHATIEIDAGGAILWYGQTLDVTERKRLEQSLADAEATRARSESLYRQVIDVLPVGVMVTNQALEQQIFNPAMQRWTKPVTDHHGDITGTYGVFMADGVTPLRMENSGTRRALRGETLEEEVVIKNELLPEPVRMHVSFSPLLDAAGKVVASVGTAMDITLQRKLEMDLRTRNEELAASEAAKATLIDRLRYSIDELSNPILEVWDDVLVMPIIGVVDSRRAADMVQRLLAEVTRTQADFVILDLTGVDVVDTKTADHLMKLMRKIEVIGARCVLTGIRAAVAETLVDIGVDLGRIITLRTLKHGLREALRHKKGQREADYELFDDGEPESGARANGRRDRA